MKKSYVLLGSSLLLLLCLSLAMPLDSYAHPALDLPTEPEPPPPDDDDGGPPSGGSPSQPDNPSPDDSSSGSGPTDYVWVQLGQCDMLSCVGAATDTAPGQAYELLAYADSAEYSAPLLIPTQKTTAVPEIIAQVRLIHDGSGFIAERMLSTHKPTKISIPYPGRWEVLLMAMPDLVSSDPVDTARLNLAQLDSKLTNGPIRLGAVDANSAAPQLVKCPIACVIEPEPAIEDPAYLPETGSDTPEDLSHSSFLMISGLGLVIVGLTFALVMRMGSPHQGKLQSVRTNQNSPNALEDLPDRSS